MGRNPVSGYLHRFSNKPFVLSCLLNPFRNDSIEELLLLRVEFRHIQTNVRLSLSLGRNIRHRNLSCKSFRFPWKAIAWHFEKLALINNGYLIQKLGYLVGKGIL